MSIEIIEDNYDLISSYPNDVCWVQLCQCEWALPICAENLNKIYWEILACYEWAYDFVRSHLDINDECNECSWMSLSSSKWAFDLLIERPDRIHWDCAIYNPKAKQLFSRHIDKVDWDFIDEIPDWLLDIIGENLGFIDWNKINMKGIQLTYPYDKQKKRIQDVRRELIEYLYYPDRVRAWIEDGNDIEDYMN